MRTHAAILVLLTGCGLYLGHGGGDDDDVCNGAPVPGVAWLVRNPYTGACEPTEGGGDGCGPCYPCPATPVPLLDEAVCGGSCDGLAEPDCLAVASCRAAYALSPSSGGGDRGSFLGCWGTAPSGPIHVGACAGLDAQTCSRHDNCSAWYVESSAGVGSFDHCGDETPDACAPATCPTPPPACPLGSVPATASGCYTGACISQSQCPSLACDTLAFEATCAARSDCVPVYRGDNCTCTPTSCTCETETYERCEAAATPL